MQIDLLVNSFVNDMARVATLQFTKSVGMAKMKWLDINDGHHTLSHEPDKNEDALSKLTKKFSGPNAKKLLGSNLDRVQLADERLPYEQLDQLTMELLMGVR